MIYVSSLTGRMVCSLYVQLHVDKKKLIVEKVNSIPCGHVAWNLRLLDQLEENLHQPAE